MKRKIITVLSTLALVIAVATPIFAWFYFPNSKGLEIDTPKAEDFSVNMYKLFNIYEDGIYVSSYFENLKEYEDENEENPYLTSNGFEIDETYEFFQWGDEYICENSEPNYYAVECKYDSDIFNDGYVKSILTSTLKSVGYELEEDAYLAFPLVNVSYKFASSSTIMTSETNAINEIKSTTGYQDIVARYYKKVNNTYIELDSNTYSSSIDKIYKRNLTEFTGNTFTSNVDYYEIAYVDNAVNYFITSDSTPSIQKRYFTGTFTEVSNLDVSYSSDSTNNYIFTNNTVDIFHSSLETTQYINATDNKLQFVIFLRVEPNESLVTDVMYEIKEDLDESLTEITIDNKLQFDFTLRSVPKKETSND